MPNPLRITKGDASVGAIQIGTGDTVYGTDMGTVSVDPAAINATSRAGTTFTLTGAKVGDIIVCNPPADLNDDLIFCGAAVTADDTVTIYLYNPTAGSINDTARTWSYLWIDLT